MQYLSVILFIIAVIGGVTMVSMVTTGKGIPIWLAVMHGIFAVVGLISVIVMVSRGTGGSAMITSLVFFIITAAGGLTLFAIYLKKKPLPNALIGVHALMAVISFIILLVAL